LPEWEVAEIALYCCEVAKGDIGKNFIYQLSELTGATVAASVTKTGGSALGGNWDLPETTGTVEAPMLFAMSILETYQCILPASGW
jgi:Domain of unknown function (DUF4347)